tara:strand:+ start:721 stop:1425 length:705 start_codon:yes stop_codon:yes gene_type:complete
MKQLNKTENKIIIETDIDFSLANAIRRSINEIPILAVDEVDIYKNDSALYDEILAHRIGLVPLKNQKLKEGKNVQFKLKVKGAKEGSIVLAGELGKDIIYPEIPLVLLNDGQELELVVRANQGIGKEHAKYTPGLVYYKQLPKITISSEGERHQELAELYPDVFEFDGKLKVKNAWASELDDKDVKNFKGIEIKLTDDLVFVIESWGQIDTKEIFIESCKALKANLNILSKALK